VLLPQAFCGLRPV